MAFARYRTPYSAPVQFLPPSGKKLSPADQFLSVHAAPKDATTVKVVVLKQRSSSPATSTPECPLSEEPKKA